jgi:serine/threonine protein kinase
MAQQEQPVRRRVALKIVKLGMDTKDVVARFDQERQALAMMDHPNIAKVFDGGATPEGRPYFVMELVPGIPITDYCDRNSLPTEERLGLFIQVCQAVQHAHLKGIIHRDIKPSNVLVCLTENSAVPKVIDFGIAKATQQRLSDLSVYTQLHAMIGTPHYMSPEQAEGSLDIDTRTDIYSLGALLYELLTGTTPFSTEELRRRGVDEIQRMIREIEPKRPSTALSAMHQEELSKVAKLRSSEAPKLIREFRSDLDWIVMKALEKDRTRRYEAANDLAGDVRRYLSGEAVVAAAPDFGYRLRKFTRRHRTPLTFAGLTSLALIAATGISLWQMSRAVTAQRETKEALGKVEEKSAELDRKSSELAKKATEQQAMLAEAARSDRFVAN